jgi:hypothetical protein
MDTTETIAPSNGAAATGQETAAGSATGQVAPEGSQGQEANAGGSQELSESGKTDGTDNGRPRFKSPQQRLYELKQQYRERESYWEKELGTVNERLTKFEKMFGPGQERKPSRTFYEAPEDTLRELLKESLEPFRENLLGEIRQTQQERDQAMSLKQEASEAAKFIRSTKGMTEDDVQEIRELLQSDTVAQRLADLPMDQAKYVLHLWQQTKGITDKTGLKNRAAGISGAPPNNGGPRQWTESEMEAELTKLGDPKDYDDAKKKKSKELQIEFRNAYRENRVKK